MSFDPLLLALGLSALATTADPTTFAPTAARSAVRIAPAALPSAPGIGDLAIDSGDGNKLKWFTGVWNTPAVAAGVANGNIQFYENGALGYSPNLIYDTATKQLQLTSDVMSYVVYADSTAQVSAAAPTVGVGVAGQQALLVDAVCGGGTLIGVRGSASVAFLGAGSTSSVTLLHGMDVATQVNVFAAAGNTFAVGNVNAQYVSQLFEAANPGAITINEATGAVYTRGINVANVDGALTLTRVFGVKVEGDTPTVSSGTLTVGTIYGLYLGAICSGIVPTTARYGIYQDDADATNYWAGNNLLVPKALPTGVAGLLVIDSGDSNKLKWYDGATWQTAGSGGGTPAGADTQVQFNNAGAFGADANLIWDNTYKYLNVVGSNADGGAALYVDAAIAAAIVSPVSYSGVIIAPTISFGEALSGVSYSAASGNLSVTITSGSDGGLIDTVDGLDLELLLTHQLGLGESVEVGSTYVVKARAVYSSDGAGSLVQGQTAGFYAEGFFTATAGTVTVEEYSGFKLSGVSIAAGYTITDLYGLFLGTASGAGTITNRYGVYQQDPDATNYWAGNNLLVPKALPTGVAGLLVIDSGDSNKLKWYDGATWQTAGGGGGTPAGADTQIQFNNAGAFGASAKFTWTDSTGTLYISSNGPGTADAIDILLFPTSTDIGDGFLVAAIGSTTSISVDSVTTSGDAYGLSVSSAVSFGASGVVNDVIGVDSTALATTSLNSYVDDVGAFRATATLDNIVAGTLTVPRLFGLSVNASITASGSGAVAVTSAYGVEVRPVSLGANATISTWYGLYLGAVTGGTVTNRYGIYQADASATNAFSGLVSITRAPSTVSGNFQSVQNLADAASAGAYSNVYLGTNYTSSGNSVSVTSIRADVNISGITATSVNGAFGFNSSIVSTKSAGVIGELTSYRAGLSNASGCTVNTLRGFYTPQTINGAVGTGYGLHVETSGSGAVTTYYGLRLQLGASAVTNHYGVYQEGATVLNYFEGSIQIVNKDVILGTGAGTKIGTATSQKLGFFNSTPVVQPNTTGETAGFTAGGGVAVDDASTFTGNVGATAYRISDIVKHLKNLGLIAA